MRVLVVEDNEASRFVICAVLERAGFECASAETPSEAERQCRESPPGVAVIDAMLGAEDGLEAAQRLRQNRPELPVLFVSGYPRGDLEARGAIAENRTGFLQKPFTPEALVTSIQSLLQAA